jgi:hypothetical protein
MTVATSRSRRGVHGRHRQVVAGRAQGLVEPVGIQAGRVVDDAVLDAHDVAFDAS